MNGDTATPTKENLAAAANFFKYHKPFREWTAELWKRSESWRHATKFLQQRILVPEVIFLGRSNVGKSTLINALLGSDLNRVSATPGMTEVMAAWGLAAKQRDGGALKGWDGDTSPKVTLVDMPGYGFGSRSEWGTQIVSYLNARRNLRRAFLLVDSVHGVMAADHHMLEIFQKLGIPYQLIATKCDRLPRPASEGGIGEALKRLKDQAQNDKSALMLDEIIAVGSLQNPAGNKGNESAFGIKELQWTILNAANLEWFAMDKAVEHKIIPKSSAQRPQGRINPELSHLIQRQVSGKEPSEPADLPSPSSSSLPNLSLEEFMREILGTDKATESSTSADSRQARDQSRDAASAKHENNRLWKSSADLHKQLESGYEELQSHVFAPTNTRDTRTTPQPRNATAVSSARRPSSFASRKPVSGGIDAFEAMFAEPPKAQSAQSQTPGPRTRGGLDNRKVAPLAPRQPPSLSRNGPSRVPQSPPVQRQPQQPSMEGKGVSQGLDAFEAMFAEPPKGRSKQAPSSGGRRKKNNPAMSSNAVTQPPRQPQIEGKGVTRGMDAFESMFAEPAKAQKARRRRS